MEDLRQAELWLDGIVEVARTQQLAGLGVLAVQIAALNHEVLDDTMEKQGIVDVHADELQEIVAVQGCLVIEGQTDVALGSLQQDLSALLCECKSAAHQQ